jgi:hypothetical protein
LTALDFLHARRLFEQSLLRFAEGIEEFESLKIPELRVNRHRLLTLANASVPGLRLRFA